MNQFTSIWVLYVCFTLSCRTILAGSAVLCKSEVFHNKEQLFFGGKRLRWPSSESCDLKMQKMGAWLAGWVGGSWEFSLGIRTGTLLG